MRQTVTFASQSSQELDQIGLATARLVNGYADAGERGPMVQSAPGLVNEVSLGSGEVYGVHATNDGIYANVGGSLVFWNGSTVTTLGALVSGYTTFANNSTQVGAVVNGRYFLWDGTTLSEPSGAAFTDFGSISYSSQRFLISQRDGEALQWSELNDGTSLDALDFASAEYKPDRLRRIVNVGGLLWMLGASTSEPWQSTGNSDLPFTRLSSSVIEKGVMSVDAADVLSNTVFWISTEGRAYRQEALAPVDISKQAPVSAFSGLTSARVFAWQWDERDFFTVRLTDRPAWVYDVQAGLWWERATGASLDAWECTCSTMWNNKWYLGTTDGYLVSLGGYQDRGAVMRREYTSTNLSNAGDFFEVRGLDMRILGNGNLMYQFSRDAGRNWSNERQKAFDGRSGDRVQWNNLGAGREFSMRIACTDNTDFTVTQTNVR